MNSQLKIKNILVDIEGTTSSISFVHEVLFPYAKENLEVFIDENYNKPEIKEIIEAALKEAQLDSKKPTEDVKKLFQKWIEEDKKIKPLKDLQGIIWQEGYKKQDFYGHIYKDAKEQLENWKKAGFQIDVYSSGSIQAQKLIFGHTEYGDLNHLFSNNFDTGIGSKKDTDSYIKIASEINTKPDEIIFLSDNSEELAAAQRAGLNVIKLARPEDQISADKNYTSVKSFNEIKL